MNPSGKDWMREAAAEIAVGEGRCPICGWTLAASSKEGCTLGNCAYRPDREGDKEQLRRKREEWLRILSVIAKHCPAAPSQPILPSPLACPTCHHSPHLDRPCVDFADCNCPIEKNKYAWSLACGDPATRDSWHSLPSAPKRNARMFAEHFLPKYLRRICATCGKTYGQHCDNDCDCPATERKFVDADPSISSADELAKAGFELGKVSTEKRWISVEEKLPDEYQCRDGLRNYVFIFGEEADPQFGLAYYDREHDYWDDGGTNEWQDEITHWMPLPDPPKGESMTTVDLSWKLRAQKAEALVRELEEALRQLKFDVYGALAIARPAIVQAIGYTNVQCIELRLEKAESLLTGQKGREEK